MGKISLRGVEKKFGNQQVLFDIFAEIKDGEFICVVGPSGCGKSTLLRLIAGLETITAGEIAIDDRVINDLEPKDRDIAMVFQNYALYPHMSVYKNMAYGLKVHGFSKDHIEARVWEAARMLGLEEYLSRKPRQLSGGQRQRVAMGRALVREPNVFLFDEPLSNLDAKLRNQMRVEIRRLHKKLRTTSVYVTHDQVEAMTLADRIIVLNEGRIEQYADPHQIYQNPGTTFVAHFIGSPSMNLVEAQLGEGDDQLILPGKGYIQLPRAVERPSGSKVLVGLRPEHLNVQNTGAANGMNCEIEAAVEMLEPLGSDMVIHCRLNGNGENLIVARLAGSAQVRENENIRLYFTGEKLHLFDLETGQLIDSYDYRDR
jgi:sn-glycerol 3-phosphate transport system ATP-binding protein